MTSRLPIGLRMAYASPAPFLAVVLLPLYVFVPNFYSDVVGVDVATVGAILLVARAFDAVSDPVVGQLSDGLRSRWGRRRPFILLGSIPLAVSIHLLLAPPADAGAAWLAGAVFLVYVSWTLVVVPYEALGVEITSDYDERTAVMALREGGGLVGILLAVATPLVLVEALDLGVGAADERRKFALFALFYAPPTALTCWFCAIALRERALPGIARGPSLATRLRDVARNRPFVVLVASFSAATMAANLPAALALYYVEHVLGSQRGELFLAIYMVAGIVCLPLWTWLARRFEKRTAWIVGLATSAVAHLSMFPLGEGQTLAFGLLIALAGAPFGGLMVLPSAMQADAIDLGEALSGDRREGLHVGIWNVARKLAGALGVGAALWVLGRRGYEANVEQTEGVRTTLRLLYCVTPAALMSLALVLSLPYAIDRERHADIRAATRGQDLGSD